VYFGKSWRQTLGAKNFVECLESAGVVQWTKEEESSFGDGQGAQEFWALSGVSRSRLSDMWGAIHKRLANIKVVWRNKSGKLVTTRIKHSSLPRAGRESWLQFWACSHLRINRVAFAMQQGVGGHIPYHLQPNHEIVNSVQFR
jgi:hypothetical protein